MVAWTPIWAIVRKDLAIWLRQPTSIAVTLLPSLGLFIIVSLSASAVGRNPVALVVQDVGPRAQQLATIVENSDAFSVKRVTSDEAERLLKNVDVAAVIRIPSGFDAAFAAHQPDPVTIEINNLNLDFTNDLRRSLPAAITAFYASQEATPIKVSVAETDLRQRDVDLAQFELIPALVLLITIAGVVNSGLATAREWEEATIVEILMAPMSRLTIIVGKLLAGWITTLLVAAVVLVLGAVSGYLRPGGIYWIPTLAVVALLALASAGLGVTLGAIFGRIQRVIPVSILLSFYLFFLSGGITVAAFLPEWVQTIARFIPTYYGVHALDMAVFYSSTEQLGRDFAIVGVTALAMIALGARSLSSRTAA